MVIYGRCMSEVSVNEDMNKGYNKGGGSREGSGTIMSTLISKELKISVE
jgi:hypothetical protein